MRKLSKCLMVTQLVDGSKDKILGLCVFIIKLVLYIITPCICLLMETNLELHKNFYSQKQNPKVIRKCHLFQNQRSC